MNPLLVRALGALSPRGTLTLVDHQDARTVLGDRDPAGPVVTVRLADARVERQLLLNPRLGAAEAFIDGRLVIDDGDVMQLASAVRGGKPFEAKTPGDFGALGATVRRLVRDARAGRNHRRAASANVAHHYDLDDRLYDRFLDPWRQYSCAYWTDDTPDLGSAQVAKLALVPGQRVLDIGCGWGGLAIAFHRMAGVDVTGITLSREQHAYATAWAAREGVADHVRFRLGDFRDLAAHDDGRPFDRIVSVGMFEHVGVPDYPAFFLRCRDLLAADGVMLLHSIGRMGGPGETDPFTRRYIFPGGYIPALSEVVPVSEAARMILTDCEVLRLHYARTLRAWYDACVASRDAIEAVYDARFFRLWTFYLAGATAAFEHGGMVNFQLQFVRDRHALPLTRDYMATAERAYRKALDAAPPLPLP